jgi:hypothetical protein
MTDAEFFYFAKDLLDWVPPDMMQIAEVDGKAVGMSLSLPDFNEALRPLNGRVFQWGMPLGLLKFRRNCKKIKASRLIAMGVLEPYRRRGIIELLVLGAFQSAVTHGHSGSECGWTLEDNEAINHAIRDAGGTPYKTYRIYDKAFV